MTKFAVCTALYEAARPYLPAYLKGLHAAAQGEELTLVLAIDDFLAPEDFLAEARAICEVTSVKASEQATPARVRRSLLLEAAAVPADVLIFADIDDVLAPDAPGLHEATLESADISFGDLRLIDASGESTGTRFFDNTEIPWQLSGADELRDRNFLGLTNTAVRRNAIPDNAFAVPETVVAVDWWLFTTLLHAGRKARRVPGNVADYRIFQDNELGLGAPTSRAALRHMIDIALRHYRAFPAVPDMALRLSQMEMLADEVSGWSSRELALALSATSGPPGVWFESLHHLMRTDTGTSARYATA